MTPKRQSSFVLVCAAAVFAVALMACGKADPLSNAPDASAKTGVAVNSTSELGYALAEIGLVQWQKSAADVSASQDAGTAETVIGVIGAGPTPLEIGAITFAPAAALTASDTQNGTFNVWKRTNYDGGAGTVQVLLGHASTFTPGLDAGTGNWLANTGVKFTLATGTGSFVSPGDTITMSITKNGTTGVSIPQGQLNLYTTIR